MLDFQPKVTLPWYLFYQWTRWSMMWWKQKKYSKYSGQRRLEIAQMTSSGFPQKCQSLAASAAQLFSTLSSFHLPKIWGPIKKLFGAALLLPRLAILFPAAFVSRPALFSLFFCAGSSDFVPIPRAGSHFANKFYINSSFSSMRQ